MSAFLRNAAVPVAAVVALALWVYLFAATVGQVGQPFLGFRLGVCQTVSDFNEPSWAGIQAGMRSGDAVLTVDGKALAAPAALAYARSLPVGTPIAYDIQREGKVRRIVVPTQRLGWFDFVSSFGVFFAIGLIMIAIGTAAVWLRPGNAAARANFWLSIGMGLWFVLNNDYDLAQRLHPSFTFWSVLLYTAGALAMVFHFPAMPAWVAARPWVRALSPLSVLGWGGLVGLVFWMEGTTPNAEAAAAPVILIWPMLVLLVAIAVFVVRHRTTPDARQQMQISVLLLGMAFAYLPGVIFKVLPSLVTGQPSAPWLTNLTFACWVLFPLSLAYAIVKHHLFDIAIIIKRTTVYASVTLFLVGGYLLTAAGIRGAASWLLGATQPSTWENMLATAVIAVAFVPVQTWITTVVDRLFFRTRYDFREVVARVTAKAQSTVDMGEMKHQFMELIDEALHPRYMYILTSEPLGLELVAADADSVWGSPPARELRVSREDPLLTRTGSAVESVYTPQTGTTGRLSQLAALGPHYRVPLQVGEEVVGLVILGPKRSDEDYSLDDRELLAASRFPLASAIKTASMVQNKLFQDRVEQDLKRAREVQEAMLPREVPAIAGYDFAASSMACYEASGDYYDFVPLADGRLGVAVADVAGKGIAAALATAMAKSGLYNQTQSDPEVIPVLMALNKLLHNVSKHAAAKSFTTCLYALLDPTTRRMTYACAGHFPPHHFRASDHRMVHYPLAAGFPLGVRDSGRYLAQNMGLATGDVVVFYTDGVTEAQAPDWKGAPLPAHVDPGEPFEADRLSDVIRAHHGQTAQEIHDAILAAVATFVGGGPQTDDITLVVMKVLPQEGFA